MAIANLTFFASDARSRLVDRTIIGKVQHSCVELKSTTDPDIGISELCQILADYDPTRFPVQQTHK
jgi:hypothetical protein